MAKLGRVTLKPNKGNFNPNHFHFFILKQVCPLDGTGDVYCLVTQCFPDWEITRTANYFYLVINLEKGQVLHLEKLLQLRDFDFDSLDRGSFRIRTGLLAQIHDTE